MFAANDLLALAILQALVLAGIRVPEDIALIGYDDISFAALASVPLSSVRQPAYQMGRRAMDLLAAAMQRDAAGGDAEGRSASQQVVFMPELAARASSLRPAGDEPGGHAPGRACRVGRPGAVCARTQGVRGQANKPVRRRFSGPARSSRPRTARAARP